MRKFGKSSSVNDALMYMKGVLISLSKNVKKKGRRKKGCV
jgi:hypothetical protein